LHNAVRDLEERECIVHRNVRIRKRVAVLLAARRIRSVVAAFAIVSGSMLAASAATPALASTPAPLVITTTSPLTATAGSAYLAKLDATGGTKPYTWTLAGGSSLPAGLTLHPANGEITGEPLGPAGTFNFIAEVTDSESPSVSTTALESITINVTPLAVTTQTLPPATAGVAYSTTLAATGGVSPYIWSIPVGSLPPGLKLRAATGVISGTPTAGGTFSFVAEVTDSETGAQSVGASESITVSTAGLVVTTASTLPTATSGVPFSVKLSAAGGITPYQWALNSGSLPAGLKLKSTGVLSGTTTVAGQDSFTVQVTDSEVPPVTATESVSLYVVNPMVVPSSLPGASLSQPYDTSLQPAGGLGPYSYAITAGSLPHGMVLESDGEITGDAAADGTSSFTVSVTDSENPPATVTQAESITVTQPVIYVATDGSDANAGTQTAPLQTIGAALTLASSFNNPVIDVAGGSYNEGSGISLISNVTINGGYSEGAWTQTSAQPTTIIGSPQAALANDATGVSINDVTLAPTAAGSSVYGLREINGSSVALGDVTIDTPNAGPGQAGAPGASGRGGDNGLSGDAGTVCGPGATGPTPGGSGGTLVTAGGAGGEGGAQLSGACGNEGNAGGQGAGPNGGAGGGPGLGNSPFGQEGFTGGNGGNGQPGAPGLGNSFATALAGPTWAGVPGNNGTNGQNSSGGGGGGGGGGVSCESFFCSNPLGTGGGGGGGGAGGADGTAGNGGGAGSGAFGIYLWDSKVSLVATTIQVGNGGSGGSGGSGGLGGPGGGGGLGGPGGNGVGGLGGNGGNGGDGGAGGAGSGGTGGPSIGIFRGDGSTASEDGASVITVGNGGAGGAGGTFPALAPNGAAGVAIAIF
jgi:Putative Ig domain